MREVYIIAFSEIFLKSEGVQRELKAILRENIKRVISTKDPGAQVVVQRERLLVFPKKRTGLLSDLLFVPGINFVAKGWFFKTWQELIAFLKKKGKDIVSSSQTFRVTLRKDSSFSVSSRALIKEVAGYLPGKVRLENPQKEVVIEWRRWGVLLYQKRFKGIGGLPVGSQGKGVLLISGGIDSPVAGFLLNKRGVELLWVHFHSFPLVSTRSIEKIEKLAEIFLKVQPKIKTYFVSIADLQLQVKREVPEKMRVLFYRWYMYKIAERIAKKEKAQFLVTGDSLGQVSSQTSFNLSLLNKAVSLPVLRPLIGFNKEEIIALAQKIGTYKISILPQEDCCSLFVPKKSSAKIREEVFREVLRKVDLKKEVNTALKQAQVRVFEK